MEEMDEDNQGDEDLFIDVRNKGKISKKDIPKRIKEINNESEYVDELNILTKYQNLTEKEKDLKKQIKEVKTQLDKNLLVKYQNFKESEIKKIVIQDKWLSSINNSINEELERISYNLTTRIENLVNRYQTPIPQLTTEMELLKAKVTDHLKTMGFKW